jgi:hypothetical protein
MAKIRLQFVNANPVKSKPLDIDKEKRDIQEALRGRADFFDAPAARMDDLMGALRNNLPQIVHFSTHGTPFKELMLFNDQDEPYGADKTAIERLFGYHRGQIRLVVLNACYSAIQAEQIRKHVDYVIGVDKTIDDEIARRYAVQLYGGLGEGREIDQVHEEITEILLRDDRVDSEHWPKLWKRPKAGRPVIIPVPSPQKELALAQRRQKYEDDRARCGVQMEGLTLTKIGNADGSATLKYSVDQLTVTNNQSVRLFNFRLESAAGLVHNPIMDERAERLSIHWNPDFRPIPQTFEDVVHNARSIQGRFSFAQRLTRQSGPYSFGWSIKVDNMDAITEWEFNNLYLTEEDRQHVDGSPLRPPRE